MGSQSMTASFPAKRLYIENSGGGGHIEAVKFYKARDKEIASITIDAMDSLGKFFGRKCAESWNALKRRGDIKGQEKLIAKHWISELIFFIPIFFRTLYNIVKHDIHEVVDCQVLGTKAVLLAARFANRFFKEFKERPVLVTKQMTDLAHSDSGHFFRSIKKLSDADRKIFRLIVPPVTSFVLKVQERIEAERAKRGTALTKEEEERLRRNLEKEFWREHTGLELNLDPNTLPCGNVSFGEFPVRSAFGKWRGRDPFAERERGFKIKINSVEELAFINEINGFQGDRVKVAEEVDGKRTISVAAAREDGIVFESVGSQMPRAAICEDVKTLIDVASEEEARAVSEGRAPKQFKMFVCCGRHVEGERNSLLREVRDLIAARRGSLGSSYPRNLQIFPMAYQDDAELAPLLCCSDICLQGAGGLTCFESLKTLAEGEPHENQKELLDRGKVLLRGVARGPVGGEPFSTAYQEELFTNGFAVWERGNARALRCHLKAKAAETATLRRALY